MILIEKSARRLSLISREKTLFTCSVGLGFCPMGHKKREGDGRTPEGRYRICTVNRQSKYHLSLGISYPSHRDAKNAFKMKRVGLWDYALISLADLLHQRPKWSSPLGGFIMIHGEDPDHRTGDWTQGCVTLTNKDMEKLASMCRKGEHVEIRP